MYEEVILALISVLYIESLEIQIKILYTITYAFEEAYTTLSISTYIGMFPKLIKVHCDLFFKINTN